MRAPQRRHPTDMTQKTILNDTHRALGAKMVDFGGWDMPLNYGSQIEEHHPVRRDAGMFDVSHMTVVDLHGARTREFLRHLLANSVDKLKVSGKALYSCMLNEQGGVIDDLIVYFLDRGFLPRRRQCRDRATRTWPGSRSQAEAFDVERHRAHRPRDDRGAGSERAREGARPAAAPDARAKAAKLGKFVAVEGDGTRSSRAPATPARTASRSSCRKRSRSRCGSACATRA